MYLCIMLIKDQFIVLRNIPYGDSSLIVKGFTREHGSQSFIVSGVRKAKSSMPMAFFEPLTLLDIVSYQKPQVSLHRLKEVKRNTTGFLGFSCSINLIWQQFFAEILFYILPDYPADAYLFDWIIKQQESFNNLDFTPFVPNLLLELADYVGIKPSMPSLDEQNCYFNLQTASWDKHKVSANPYARPNTHQLIVSKDRLSTVQLGNQDIFIIIDDLITFYKYQLPNFKQPETLKLLWALP